MFLSRNMVVWVHSRRVMAVSEILEYEVGVAGPILIEVCQNLTPKLLKIGQKVDFCLFLALEIANMPSRKANHAHKSSTC